MKAYKIGYCRVSTKEQDVGLQRAALEKAGCDEIHEEKASGAKRDRPVLQNVLSRLRPGDTLAVWKLDRIARSCSHLIAISEDLERRGIELVSLTEKIDTSSPMGKAMFQICGIMAELERNLIEERREAGIARARADGKKFGRKPLSDPSSKGGKAGKLAMALREVERGSSVRAASMRHGVARSTITRHLDMDLEQTNSDIVSNRKRTKNGHVNGNSVDVPILTSISA
jgi:DNA invertase Pin-like site-specific DNA recombinase